MPKRNPDQRTVDLRAKYRKEYGNDWWQDEDIKSQYDAEKRAIYRGDVQKKSSRSSTRKTRSKGTAGMKLQEAVEFVIQEFEKAFPDEDIEIEENYGDGGTTVVFLDQDDRVFGIELIKKRKKVHYQVFVEHSDGVQDDFAIATGIIGKDDFIDQITLIEKSLDLVSGDDNESSLTVEVFYDGRKVTLEPGDALYEEYKGLFLKK